MDFQHILVIPIPLRGHMVPMVNLCCKLASRRCCKRITILISEEKLDTLNELLEPLEENGNLPKGLVSPQVIPFTFPPAFTGGDEAVIHSFRAVEAMGDPARELAFEISKEHHVTCVLADLLLSWPQDIADQLGVPRIALHILELAEMAIALHMPALIAQEIFSPFKDLNTGKSQLIHVPGLPPLLACDLPQVSQFPNTNAKYWEYLLRVYGRAKEAKVVLSNSCYELEGKTLESMLKNHKVQVMFAGPLLTPPSKLPVRGPCIDWLDMKAPRSVIYVSFGSFLQWKSSELEELLFGIKESGYNFLIAYRGDVLAGDPSSELESFLDEFRGAQDRESDLEASNKQGLIVDWAPQMEVLNHGSTGGHFTHYGWNSLSESISAGVPLIGRPVLGDHFVLKKMSVEMWKIAVNIEVDEEGRMSKAAVKAAVLELMQSLEIRQNSLKLKDCVAKTLSEGGSSYSCFDRL